MKEETSSVHHKRKQKLFNELAAAEDLLQSTELLLAEEMGRRQNTLFSKQEDIDVSLNFIFKNFQIPFLFAISF